MKLSPLEAKVIALRAQETVAYEERSFAILLDNKLKQQHYQEESRFFL